jgi:hypothetical protein
LEDLVNEWGSSFNHIHISAAIVNQVQQAAVQSTGSWRQAAAGAVQQVAQPA